MFTGSKAVLGIMWFGLFAMIAGCQVEHVKTGETQEKRLVTVPSPTNIVAVVKQDSIARHREEDRLWADRTNLKPEQVRLLRLMSDVSDDEEEFIDNLDTQSLKKLNHVLLVTASGNGHCLNLIVFERKINEFQRVWSTNQTPSGAGFCRESPKNPEAFASADGDIAVKVPVFDYNKGIDKTANIYVYAWNGETYHSIDKKLSVWQHSRRTPGSNCIRPVSPMNT